jgi:hypothetical protein
MTTMLHGSDHSSLPCKLLLQLGTFVKHSNGVAKAAMCYEFAVQTSGQLSNISSPAGHTQKRENLNFSCEACSSLSVFPQAHGQKALYKSSRFSVHDFRERGITPRQSVPRQNTLGRGDLDLFTHVLCSVACCNKLI